MWFQFMLVMIPIVANLLLDSKKRKELIRDVKKFINKLFRKNPHNVTINNSDWRNTKDGTNVRIYITFYACYLIFVSIALFYVMLDMKGVFPPIYFPTGVPLSRSLVSFCGGIVTDTCFRMFWAAYKIRC